METGGFSGGYSALFRDFLFVCMSVCVRFHSFIYAILAQREPVCVRESVGNFLWGVEWLWKIGDKANPGNTPTKCWDFYQNLMIGYCKYEIYFGKISNQYLEKLS